MTELSAADLEAMRCSEDKGGVSQVGNREPRQAAAPSSQPALQRAVLGLLTENGQCLRACSQGTTIIRHFSGSENTFPPGGKNTRPSCMVNATSKQGFAIYIDEPEQKERYKCTVVEEVEPSLCEVASSTVKSSIHLLLNLSTGSPMVVDTSFQNRSEDQLDASFQSQHEDQVDNNTDVMNVGEYAEDIHQYLREAEVRYRPKPYYMRKQPDITAGMRAILVDWLVEVGEEYKLRTETLYLAVNFLDRFLSCMSVLRGKLQLVGTAAVLLAAKYEEIYPPEVDEFVYITDDTYTKRQLLRMEHLLLKYVAELSLLEIDPFLKYLPSQTAAAAYCLANYTVNKHLWPETLAAFTGYSLSEIVPCLSDLHKACLDAPHRQQQAIREKYKLSKYMHVSLLEPPAVLPLQ
ncbi:cyclin-A1 isoform A [Alligator mississippiensis]|uniref:Cyclin-A1 isoform A n=2 Tax=Alligator mississippiensis TaxID=8496 RepID=A0A151MPK2_ALLMI|nr:cyclin-A1 isoform A [Alligator mississippiensis]